MDELAHSQDVRLDVRQPVQAAHVKVEGFTWTTTNAAPVTNAFGDAIATHLLTVVVGHVADQLDDVARGETPLLYRVRLETVHQPVRSLVLPHRLRHRKKKRRPSQRKKYSPSSGGGGGPYDPLTEENPNLT